VNTINDEHMKILYEACYRFARRSHTSWDEWLGTGWIGLKNAIERFDPKAGTKFSTFAYRKIMFAILDEARGNGRWRTRRRNNYVEKKMCDLSAEDQRKAIASVPPDTSIEDNDEVAYLSRGMSRRFTLEVKLLIDGYGQKEIGDVVGCSPSQVSLDIERVIRPAVRTRYEQKYGVERAKVACRKSYMTPIRNPRMEARHVNNSTCQTG
jgi:RNA polymerase sigma factor (sigma-70 family)